MTIDQLIASFLVTGEGVLSSNWDSRWRKRLVLNLAVMVGQLWQVGITRIFIDGSFVEEKDHPNDIDGYFEVDLRYRTSGRLERDLNALDPYKIWTWDRQSRRPDINSTKRQLPMWHQYRVELYPQYRGLLSGIRDTFGYELPFPAAFRVSRSGGRPKGIVQIVC